MLLLGENMAGFFSKSLGFILLVATIGLASCQSMLNASADDTSTISSEKTKGIL